MSRRRELARRIAALTDIRGILGAMKNLAVMETRILKDFLETQRRMVAGIEVASADFFAWYGDALPQPGKIRDVIVVIGSEQGFCGDFNETIVQAGQRELGESGWVVVGRRISSKLEGEARVARAVPGATVTDEVPAALRRLADELDRLQPPEDGSPRSLSAFYHCAATGEIRLHRLLPLPHLPPPSHYTNAPETNLQPAEFLSELTRHCLYAALHEILYSSLMSENQQRLAHMDRALQRLDKDAAHLKLVFNAQRQEEIIEEIEVLLLSADAVS